MKKGVLLVNLGSPDSTDPKDVKKYLDEFLMDECVIDLPFWLRSFVVKGIILNTRPKKSAAAYQKIWWKEGSPLVVISKRLEQKVQQKTNLPVVMAMRYGNPSIKKGLKKLHDKGVTSVFVIPLYPQYAMSTTETVVGKVLKERNAYFPKLKLKYQKPFYNDDQYISVLANSIKKELPKEFDRLVFSYHGVPLRHIVKKDNDKRKAVKQEYFGYKTTDEETNYQKHCYKTTALVQQKLNLPDSKVLTAFQSRLGLDSWLKPYFSVINEQLPKQDIKKIVVVTPAFVSDCLETLEEIAMEGKHQFLEAGGEKYKTIPCINDDDNWADLIAQWIKKQEY